MRRYVVMWLVSIATPGCASTSYNLTFQCVGNEGGSVCPVGQSCPEVPLGSGGCDNLPGLFGHPETRTDAGRPVGCDVGLPYGKSTRNGSMLQVHCYCSAPPPGRKPSSDAEVAVTPRWRCLIVD
jgi:hypothetical protein